MFDIFQHNWLYSDCLRLFLNGILKLRLATSYVINPYHYLWTETHESDMPDMKSLCQNYL